MVQNAHYLFFPNNDLKPPPKRCFKGRPEVPNSSTVTVDAMNGEPVAGINGDGEILDCPNGDRFEPDVVVACVAWGTPPSPSSISGVTAAIRVP